MQQPNPIDVAVGGNLRAMRVRSGMSQGTLGIAVGITFQQVQKYENATNRISASRLVDFARALNCSVRDFFQGIQPIAEAMEEKPELTNEVRARLSELCKSMAIELGLNMNVGGVYDNPKGA